MKLKLGGFSQIYSTHTYSKVQSWLNLIVSINLSNFTISEKIERTEIFSMFCFILVLLFVKVMKSSWTY